MLLQEKKCDLGILCLLSRHGHMHDMGFSASSVPALNAPFLLFMLRFLETKKSVWNNNS